MSYYLIDLVYSEDSWGPAMPKDHSGFLLLADVREATFGLYQTDYIEDKNLTPQITPVSFLTLNLLDSAIDYPPAMALTRLKMERSGIKTKDLFVQFLNETLRTHLKMQPFYPFFMAEVISSSDIDLGAGGFNWIAEFTPQGKNIMYFSGDYFIYAAPREDFLIDEKEFSKPFSYKEFLKETK